MGYSTDYHDYVFKNGGFVGKDILPNYSSLLSKLEGRFKTIVYATVHKASAGREIYFHWLGQSAK